MDYFSGKVCGNPDVYNQLNRYCFMFHCNLQDVNLISFSCSPLSYSPSLKEEKDRLNRSQHDELLVPCDDELLRPRVTVSRHDDLLIPKVTEVDHALKEYEENMQKTVRVRVLTELY